MGIRKFIRQMRVSENGQAMSEWALSLALLGMVSLVLIFRATLVSAYYLGDEMTYLGSTNEVNFDESEYAKNRPSESTDKLWYKIEDSTLYIRATAQSEYSSRDMLGDCVNGWINNKNILVAVIEEPIAPYNCSYLFSGCSGLQVIMNQENLYTDYSKFFNCMFDGCSSLMSLDCSKWNTRKGLTFYYMFNNCSSLSEVDLSNFRFTCYNNVNPKDMVSCMFNGCSNLRTIYVSEKNKDKMAEYIDSTDVFTGCYNIMGGTGKTYSNGEITNASTEKGYLTIKAIVGDSST